MEIPTTNQIMYVPIPERISIGGVSFRVKLVDRCEDNNLGNCCVAEGRIEIAELWDKNRHQSEDSKKQTFYHELVHCILDTMGENELSKNERFVNIFASFLNEALKDSRFIGGIGDYDMAGY